ncbi:hypothetical protein B0T17DRAFT_502134 [Bombardia bombarda]|uniref:Uncharacterized protein n=1 Tax=Bombardia bombarda TaxID=252184 RepID=A0AA40CEI5_9PEZI|nr:hypothetical protein B0T17DRAFT_502134 [Bombardia bombarda]
MSQSATAHGQWVVMSVIANAHRRESPYSRQLEARLASVHLPFSSVTRNSVSLWDMSLLTRSRDLRVSASPKQQLSCHETKNGDIIVQRNYLPSLATTTYLDLLDSLGQGLRDSPSFRTAKSSTSPTTETPNLEVQPHKMHQPTSLLLSAIMGMGYLAPTLASDLSAPFTTTEPSLTTIPSPPPPPASTAPGFSSSLSISIISPPSSLSSSYTSLISMSLPPVLVPAPAPFPKNNTNVAAATTTSNYFFNSTTITSTSTSTSTSEASTSLTTTDSSSSSSTRHSVTTSESTATDNSVAATSSNAAVSDRAEIGRMFAIGAVAFIAAALGLGEF